MNSGVGEPSNLPSSPLGALEKAEAMNDVEESSSQNLQTPWESHPANPRTWSSIRKWSCLGMVSGTALLSTLTSSMPIPAIPQVRDRFDVENGRLVTFSVSVYILGVGLGPLLFAPLSEVYGRKPIYVVTMSLLTVFQLACGFSNTFSSLVILRFIAGCLASAGPGGVGVASVADLFDLKQRGRALSLYGSGPMLGPPIGSLIGSFVAPALGWRWIYYILTLATAANTALLFVMRETFAPVIKERIYPQSHSLNKRAEARAILLKALRRPPRLLANPVCLIFSVYYAYVYAVLYLSLVMVPLLYDQSEQSSRLFSYGWTSQLTGLAYIGIAVGLFSATIFGGMYQNKIYTKLSARNNGVGRPEFRLILVQLGMLVFPIGELVFGWPSQAHAHWIVPQIGSVIYCFGLMLAFSASQGFLVDYCGPEYGASAIAGAVLLRSISACVLPIFGNDIFRALGWGWGCSLLALLTLPAIPVPTLLYIFGPQLRARYQLKV